MKKCFIILAAAVMALCAQAVDFNVVKIHLNDKSTVDLVINDDVKMSFTETHLQVEGLDSEVSIERSKISKFTHSLNPELAIDEVKADGAADVKGDKIVFHGLPAGTEVSVYNLGGVQVMSVKAEGDYQLNLNGLGHGVYVVSAQGNSFKVTVK